MNGWISAFGFSDHPFSKEIEDHHLWLPPSKQALLDEIADALGDRASVLLTGEPGVGKTCVLRALRHRLPHQGFRLTYCHNATLGRRDFYRLSTHIEELGRERIHPIFLLDEAHLLHQDTLDHLHILLNYEWDRRALLSLVLIGLPELHDRLTLRRNRCLYSRIHARLHIDPLRPEDSAAYLTFRLGRVGCDRDLFTQDAIAMLHEATAGALRDMDRLATVALRNASSSNAMSLPARLRPTRGRSYEPTRTDPPPTALREPGTALGCHARARHQRHLARPRRCHG
jgi:type II secretory pathway predicted ATPase ExeA